jgi:photosystem II stability/assembly factor-like uncharacterized protein
MFLSKPKKFILINMVVLLFLSLGFSSVLAAGWELSSRGDIQALRSIIKSGDNLVAVGNTGKIITSTDGEAWEAPISQGNGWYYKVGLQTNGELLATGQDGIFVTSTDSGVSWSQISYGVSKHIFDFETVGKTGYMAGAAGTFLYYDANLGIWRSRSVGQTVDLYGVHDMGNGENGWVVGYSGKIIKLSQSGFSYAAITSGTTETLNDIIFTSDLIGFTVGTKGTLLKTIDGGDTWTTSEIPNVGYRDLYSIDASGNNLAIAGDKVLLFSDDLGETWNLKDYSGTFNIFHEAYFEDENTLWAVGTDFDVNSIVYKYDLTPAVVEPPVVEEPEETVEAQQGSLVKLSCGVEAKASDPCKAVYFYATDGKRHAFPNSKIFFTWFEDFNSVKEVTPEFMSSLTLGKNVTYHPGTKMVKFRTVNTVYAVSKKGELRAIGSEAVAKSLYGDTWNKQIDDISDVFISNYSFGTKIEKTSDYSVNLSKISVTSLNDNF